MKHLLLPIFAAAGLMTVTASTSDADVATAVQAAFTEKDKAKKETEDAKAALVTATTALAAAEKKVADMEEEETKAKALAATAAVTALVDDAVAAGKITASLVPTYTTLATANLESATAAIAALPARKSLTDGIDANANMGTGTISAAAGMAEIHARTTAKAA